MSLSLSALHIRAVLLDIEGTTTPVDFVYQVLFPYARTHLHEFLAREWNGEGCREAVSLLQRERTSDLDLSQGDRATLEFGQPAVEAFVKSLMDQDRKSPGLKMLQGLIWKDGYQRGDLHGSVYADVPPALDRWRASGRDVYIYSSGSVLAQQLLFGSTDAGDLTTRLNGYFDTAVGPKQSPASYRVIVSRINVQPSEIFFVSDVVAELDAARESGLRTSLCERGAAVANPNGHPVILTFDEVVA